MINAGLETGLGNTGDRTELCTCNEHILILSWACNPEHVSWVFQGYAVAAKVNCVLGLCVKIAAVPTLQPSGVLGVLAALPAPI